MKRHNDRTAAGGTAFVSMVVNLNLRWIYRPQDHPGTDYGVDAHIEVTDAEGVETGRQVAAQIKAGKSYFNEEIAAGFVNRPIDRHVKYWRSYALPVILILVDEKEHVAYWAYTDRVEETEGGGWKLLVPRHQVLDTQTKIPLSEIAVGAGTERTRAKSEERERTEHLERRIAELEGVVSEYLAQLAVQPETRQPGVSHASIDVLALTFSELIEWADRADFDRGGVPAENRAAYVLAAEQLFYQKTIDEHDAARAVTLLLLAQEWIKAGATFLYCIHLTRHLSRVESPSIIDFLSASTLPPRIPLDLRMIIRSFQITARRKHGRPNDNLLEELDCLVAEATPSEGYALAAAAFSEARSVGRQAPARALRYIRAAAALRPNATGFRGGPFPTSIDKTWTLMLELTAAGVASKVDLEAWLETLESVPAEARETFLLDEMNSVTLANRFWLDESVRPPEDRGWSSIHSLLESIEEWSVSRSATLLFASARRGRVIVRGEYENDLRGAIKLATDVPAVIQADSHAMFLLNEIAASQFLYAGALMESFVAFRAALATRPHNSSILPTALLKASQAAAASEDFTQGIAWARDGVEAATRDRYRTSTDIVVARAELALAVWFGGEREMAIDMWDEVTEELFAIEEDTPRWRGLAVRFHWVGGYLESTYRTGRPPTADAEGKPYGEPRPGSFLIDLSGQAAGFTDKVRFGILLGLAAIADQRALDMRTRRWVYAAFDLAKARIPEWWRVTALFALPHLISDGRFTDAISLGHQMGDCWETENFLGVPDSHIVAISFTLVPAVLAIAQKSVNERTSAAQMLRLAINEEMESDPTWTKCAKVIELGLLSTHDPVLRRIGISDIRTGDTARLKESPLPMLCDLTESLIPETAADSCLALHARALTELQARLSIYATMYRLHIVPFFEEFWQSRIASEPQAFIDPKRLKAALRSNDQFEIGARPFRVLCAVARDLRLF